MAQNPIYFRKTTLDDLRSINRILNDVINSSPFYLSNTTKSINDTNNWYKEHQNSDYYVSLSAIVNNEFAGWVSLSPFRNANGYDITAELSIYVDPKFYRRGIAKQMMVEIEQYAIDKNKLYNIISVITSTNQPSITLHEKMGYAITGILKEIAVKNEILQDVILMTKKIKH